MCGIVGYVGNQSAQEIVISGLEKLEYRGYDSAGIALLNPDLDLYRAKGKLIELKKILNEVRPNRSQIGIGHTRWATHGKPTTDNAHPHRSGGLCLIHNGIVENYAILRDSLIRSGVEFKSETDTEVAVHLINQLKSEGHSTFNALQEACKKIKGTYAFVMIDEATPDKIYVAKQASPVVLGLGEGENFVASDVPAILNFTRDVIFLEDGDFAEISSNGLQIFNQGNLVDRKIDRILWDPVTAQKGGFKHYMLKEISEQGRVVADTIRARINLGTNTIELNELENLKPELKNIERILILGCGTAYHAGLVAKFYFENLVGVTCEVDYASEFRYRSTPVNSKTLVVVISQSGETADTLAALEYCKNKTKTLAICNVLGSSIARKADFVLYTHAGPEISVASTKAFLTQLVASLMLACFIAQEKKSNLFELESILKDLIHLPQSIEKMLELSPVLEKLAKKYHKVDQFLFIGRGICYPIALEGALKLKEISYIHAEGYPAGELKHGPIALVDEEVPVVVIIQKSAVLTEKTLSNLKEVESRGGKIIAVTDAGTHGLETANDIIEVEYLSQFISPILTVIPLQMLAYYVAVYNGTDVDLPRNLAKSVTVE